ncbi:MAG: 16S rRNA (cytosine(1402)-N(4))-methyltransferase RsmH [Acidimicrobiaceae bacterium]|nr:16S rRNA (cytosine(1402)-N(4))-methyltransferase RsmH [Acidimicrobiaceae bacterium]MYG99838.1 16S rRNA (cytosine(1402)-N(4))-methyltransferase RsmH [Acidimicrobiaceae bacterium]MYL03553.1 16S rRNA (cytosine(1402)-N(4))-methyltransferase RsmH [Acidimicrobiaceae bacterium]
MSGETGAGQPQYHQPVMCREVVDVLRDVPEGVVLDATVGDGGHTDALLENLPHIRLVGLDRDPEALMAAAERLAPHRHRVTLHRATFDALGTVLDSIGQDRISACLFDLGVSSRQLDRPERGFSYRLDGPLDMRMDPDGPVTAADIVNGESEDALAVLLRRNADERYARRIAAAVVAQRPFTTTRQLARTVAGAVPATTRRRAHPARRTFQALRIEVNGELEMLERSLTGAIDRLVDGGRCAVLSYHSGEDRIVKSVFRLAAGESPPPRPGLPPAPGAPATVRLLGRRSRTPTETEKAANHRAGSARLRAVERLDQRPSG